MAWGNSAKITNKEFYSGVARYLGIKPETAKRYWIEGVYEFIVREIYFRGSCTIPNVGTFYTKTVAESYQTQKDKNGKKVSYKVPERSVPYFVPHDTMINDINMHGVTKEYRRRYKNGKLTEADFRRQIRAEALGVEGGISEEHIKSKTKNFQKMLDKKVKEAEEKDNEKT